MLGTPVVSSFLITGSCSGPPTPTKNKLERSYVAFSYSHLFVLLTGVPTAPTAFSRENQRSIPLEFQNKYPTIIELPNQEPKSCFSALNHTLQNVARVEICKAKQHDDITSNTKLDRNPVMNRQRPFSDDTSSF